MEGIEMFTLDNTEGFTQSQLDDMNAELQARLEIGELYGIPEDERIKIISEDICKRF